MKKLTCYDCDESFDAQTSPEMLDHFHAHYIKKHKEIITGVNEEEKKAWMDKFNWDWDNISDK